MKTAAVTGGSLKKTDTVTTLSDRIYEWSSIQLFPGYHNDRTVQVDAALLLRDTTYITTNRSAHA